MIKIIVMNEHIFDDIKCFIEKLRWKYPFELKRETKIEQDLGITGDEAYEFIDAFSKQFSVDISNFRFEDYFEPEGDWILPTLIRFCTGKKKEKKRVLTLGDLERAIETKEIK
jgi:acyl carrier protein